MPTAAARDVPVADGADLIVLRPQGLYCPAGDFHIDPWRPVARAVITHAHADHARRGHGAYLCSAPGEGVLRSRLGSIQLQTLGYGQRLTIGGTAVSLHPAGHVLGSAQVRVEHRGRVWVASGDYFLTGEHTADLDAAPTAADPADTSTDPSACSTRPPCSLSPHTSTDPPSPSTHSSRVALAGSPPRTSAATTGARIVNPSTRTTSLPAPTPAPAPAPAPTPPRPCRRACKLAAHDSSNSAAPGTTTDPCSTWSASQSRKMPVCSRML